MKKVFFFISSPSAIDGNLFISELFNLIGYKGHEIVVDLTYIGLTNPKITRVYVDNPAISTVVTSLSKPMGLYYHRIGFAFSRRPIASLVGNKWFKNILSIMIADRMLSQYGLTYFYDQYKNLQQESCDYFSEKFQTFIQPSHVLLLGHTIRHKNNDQLTQFVRDNISCRLCLTPYFLYKTDGMEN